MTLSGSYALLRHIVPSMLIGIGMAVGLIASVPAGVVITSTGIALAAFDHICSRMDENLIRLQTNKRDRS